MGAGASVDDFSEEVYHLTGNTVKPRMVYSIDFYSREIFCKRDVPTNKFHALSHRWQNREENTSWTVKVDNEETYECQLENEEAKNLDHYLKTFGQGIWLDYVCINQNSADDKNAQVSIMGQIFLGCCTLVVGPNLSPTMPPDDYCSRAWCIQERMFGPIKFPWNFAECDSDRIQWFATAMIWRIPSFGDALKLTDDYHYTEEWRVKSLQMAKKLYPHVENIIEDLINLMVKNKDKKQRAILALSVREKIPCTHDVDDPKWFGKWSCLTFTCDSLYMKDRLYGVWGVPMYMKGVALPYDNVRHAFMLIKKYYPMAYFAAYSIIGQNFLTVNRFQSTDVALTSILSENSEAINSAVPLLDAVYFRVCVHNIAFSFAISDCSVGFGWDSKGVPNPSKAPIYVVMHHSIIHNVVTHESLTMFCDLIKSKGCPIKWDTAYTLWTEVKSVLHSSKNPFRHRY